MGSNKTDIRTDNSIRKGEFRFILYLDMDGVLTSEDYIIKIHDSLMNDMTREEYRYRSFMHQYCFQTEAIDCLNKVYDKFPFVTILSSTRRFEFIPTEWNTIFKINNYKSYIGGRTNKLKHYTNDRYYWRADEIRDYHFEGGGMFTFKNIPFIIIDDDNFDLLEFEDKLIHVDTKHGLTLDYYDEIIQKLEIQGVK